MTAINEQTFPAIHAEYTRVVTSRIRRHAIPARDAEDVSQSAWTLIWEQRERQQAVPLSTFIAVKASDAVALYWRHHKPWMNLETLTIADDVEYEEDQVAASLHVPVSPASQETTVIINDVLSRLPAQYRAALEEHAEREIKLGVRLSGQETAVLHRARKKFMAMWQNGVQKRIYPPRTTCKRGHDVTIPRSRTSQNRCKSCSQVAWRQATARCRVALCNS